MHDEDPRFQANPYTVLDELRGAAPVMWDADFGQHYLTRHDDIRQILRDELQRSGQAADTSAASRELSERRLLDRIDSAVTARLGAVRGTTPRGNEVVPMTELERQRLLSDIQSIVRNQVQEAMSRQEAQRPQQQPPVVQPYYPPTTERVERGERRRFSPRSFSAYTG